MHVDEVGLRPEGDVLLQRRQKVSLRRAAREGKAKTKVIFDQMNHQQEYSNGEHSRVSIGSRWGGENQEENDPPSTSSKLPHESSFPKVASIKPPGPPYHPVLVPEPPSLPKGIIFVAFQISPQVQTAHKPHINSQQLLTPAASPLKKSKYTAVPQIPTQGSVPNTVTLEQAGEEADLDSDLVFDDLVHPPKEAWTNPEISRSFVVLFSPTGSSSSQMSQPKALFEPPPSSIPPPSFMFNYFAKLVDAVPDED